jgi:hypothetical protein
MKMSDHKTHEQHSHTHGPGCGHTAVKHEAHVDYLHEGHLHSVHQGNVDGTCAGGGWLESDHLYPDSCLRSARREAHSWCRLRT